MSDLISRQALKERLDEHYQLLNDDERFEQCDACVDFDYLIDSMPTAYSADKVVDGMNELKPCPFCGGEAEVNLILGNYCVTCTNCMGGIHPARRQTREEAVEAWNRRAGDAE